MRTVRIFLRGEHDVTRELYRIARDATVVRADGGEGGLFALRGLDVAAVIVNVHGIIPRDVGAHGPSFDQCRNGIPITILLVSETGCG